MDFEFNILMIQQTCRWDSFVPKQISTYSHGAEGASIEPVSRLVVKQHSTADVHGIRALAHDDRVLRNVRLDSFEYCEVV